MAGDELNSWWQDKQHIWAGDELNSRVDSGKSLLDEVVHVGAGFVAALASYSYCTMQKLEFMGGGEGGRQWRSTGMCGRYKVVTGASPPRRVSKSRLGFGEFEDFSSSAIV
jgi:hypothetical protein